MVHKYMIHIEVIFDSFFCIRTFLMSAIHLYPTSMSSIKASAPATPRKRCLFFKKMETIGNSRSAKTVGSQFFAMRTTL